MLLLAVLLVLGLRWNMLRVCGVPSLFRKDEVGGAVGAYERFVTKSNVPRVEAVHQVQSKKRITLERNGVAPRRWLT